MTVAEYTKRQELSTYITRHIKRGDKFVIDGQDYTYRWGDEEWLDIPKMEAICQQFRQRMDNTIDWGFGGEEFGPVIEEFLTKKLDDMFANTDIRMYDRPDNSAVDVFEYIYDRIGLADLFDEEPAHYEEAMYNLRNVFIIIRKYMESHMKNLKWTDYDMDHWRYLAGREFNKYNKYSSNGTDY